jgi:hypothetical protein
MIRLSFWFYVSLGVSVLALFLIYLSSAISKKTIGAFVMFFFAILGSAVLWHGLNSAEKQANYNLGRPDPVFSDTVKKKVYLISSGKDEDISQGMHFFEVNPDDKLLQKILRELRKKKAFVMKVGKPTTQNGTIQQSFEFHPEPPPSSEPKN